MISLYNKTEITRRELSNNILGITGGYTILISVYITKLPLARLPGFKKQFKKLLRLNDPTKSRECFTSRRDFETFNQTTFNG